MNRDRRLPRRVARRLVGLAAPWLFALGLAQGAGAALVAEWRMDEAAWTGAPGEVLDSSGNGHHGTARGQADLPAPEPGRVCNGGRFRGQGYNVPEPPWYIDAQHYVEIPQAPALSPLAAGNNAQLAISGWFRPDGDGTLLHKGEGGATQEYRLYLAGGRLRFVIWNRWGGPVSVSFDTALQTGQWYFFYVDARRLGASDNVALTGRLYGAVGDEPIETQNWGNQNIPLDNKDTSGRLFLGATSWGGAPTNFFDGMLDELRIYATRPTDAEILAHKNLSRPCPVIAPQHVRLLHPGQGLTCAPATVSVQVCANADCSQLFQDPVQLTLTTSPAGGVVVPNPLTVTGGQATVSLRYTTPGTLSLGLAAASPQPEAATRCFVGATESCALTFHEAGFLFDFTAAQPLLAGRTATPVTIQAVKADPADPQSCAPAFSGSRSVGLWFAYADPGSGSHSLEVNGTPLGTAAPGTPLQLDFDAQARAVLSLDYADAGLLHLHARYEGQNEEAGLVMTGSKPFVMRPAGLCVDTPAAEAGCDPAGPGCSVFRRAGEGFPLRITAVAYRSDDGGDRCLDRAARITPNFRLADVPLSADLVAPAGGHPGQLAVGSVDFDAAASGEALIPAQAISEVGVFRIQAAPAPGAYHGLDVPGGVSANLGRFTPYDFAVTLENTPGLAPACGRFTYLSQWFGYHTPPSVRIRARNRDGAVTRNYDGVWWRLPGISPAYQHAGTPQPLPGDVSLVHDAVHDPIDCAAGGCQGAVSVGFGGQFTYERGNTPVDPMAGALEVTFEVVDADGIAYAHNPFTFNVGFEGGDDTQRWGRLEMANAYGPELLPLTVPMHTAYYQDGAFRLNTEDGCTEVPSAAVALDVQLGSGSTTAEVLNEPAAAGRIDVRLTAPGAGNTGYVDVEPDLSVDGADLPWLLFDWDGDGTERGPEARATFGIYGGNERQIYIRELP